MEQVGRENHRSCAVVTPLKTDTLIVSRGDLETRRYSRVGVLSYDRHIFRFDYDDGVTRALPGLPLRRVHESKSLVPIFAERVMDPHRPERAETLEQLGLAATAEPLEVLAVSGGGRTGDTYELTPLPQPGPVSLPFLVHGIRHLKSEERSPGTGASALIGMSGNAGGPAGGGEALWGHLRSRLPASGQTGVGVGDRVLLSGAVVDEALV